MQPALQAWYPKAAAGISVLYEERGGRPPNPHGLATLEGRSTDFSHFGASYKNIERSLQGPGVLEGVVVPHEVSTLVIRFK